MPETAITLPSSPEVDLAFTEALTYCAGPQPTTEKLASVRWRLRNLITAQHLASTAPQGDDGA